MKFTDPAVRAVFGSDAPSTAGCLRLLDDSVSGRRDLTPDEQRACDLIDDRVKQTYGGAAVPLLDGVGRFCSYCESQVNELTNVEHVLPKAEYPTYALDWENLLPACGACNRPKSNHPTRSAVAERIGQAHPPPEACFDHIRGAYRWPDVDELDGYFVVALHAAFDGTWQRCPDQLATDAGLELRDLSVDRGRVLADMPGIGEVPVAALVVPGRSDARASATIELLKLAVLPVPGKPSDRRTLYRTEAWIDAVAMLRLLADGDVPLTATITQMAASGFWRTWISVADIIGPGLGTTLRDATGASPRKFPGTDGGRLR